MERVNNKVIRNNNINPIKDNSIKESPNRGYFISIIKNNSIKTKRPDDVVRVCEAVLLLIKNSKKIRENIHNPILPKACVVVVFASFGCICMEDMYKKFNITKVEDKEMINKVISENVYATILKQEYAKDIASSIKYMTKSSNFISNWIRKGDAKLDSEDLKITFAVIKQVVSQVQSKRIEMVFGVEPENIEKRVEFEPKKIEKRVEFEPENIEKRVEFEPEKREERVEVKPKKIEKIEEVFEVEPEKIKKRFEFEPEKREERVEVKPKKIEEVFEVEPKKIEKIEEVFEVEPEEINPFDYTAIFKKLRKEVFESKLHQLIHSVTYFSDCDASLEIIHEMKRQNIMSIDSIARIVIELIGREKLQSAINYIKNYKIDNLTREIIDKKVGDDDLWVVEYLDFSNIREYDYFGDGSYTNQISNYKFRDLATAVCYEKSSNCTILSFEVEAEHDILNKNLNIFITAIVLSRLTIYSSGYDLDIVKQVLEWDHEGVEIKEMLYAMSLILIDIPSLFWDKDENSLWFRIVSAFVFLVSDIEELVALVDNNEFVKTRLLSQISDLGNLKNYRYILESIKVFFANEENSKKTQQMIELMIPVATGFIRFKEKNKNLYKSLIDPFLPEGYTGTIVSYMTEFSLKSQKKLFTTNIRGHNKIVRKMLEPLLQEIDQSIKKLEKQQDKTFAKHNETAEKIRATQSAKKKAIESAKKKATESAKITKYNHEQQELERNNSINTITSRSYSNFENELINTLINNSKEPDIKDLEAELENLELEYQKFQEFEIDNDQEIELLKALKKSILTDNITQENKNKVLDILENRYPNKYVEIYKTLMNEVHMEQMFDEADSRSKESSNINSEQISGNMKLIFATYLKKYSECNEE